jgi:hypothetical protein
MLDAQAMRLIDLKPTIGGELLLVIEAANLNLASLTRSLI